MNVDDYKLKWLPDEPGTYTFHEALKLEDATKRLPTIGELRIAWEQGMEFKNNWYWSSSVNPNITDFAYVFNGYNGSIYYYYRNFFNGFVRCVGRAL